MAVTVDRRDLRLRERLARHKGSRQMALLGHQPRSLEIDDVVAGTEMPDAEVSSNGKPAGGLGDIADYDR